MAMTSTSFDGKQDHQTECGLRRKSFKTLVAYIWQDKDEVRMNQQQLDLDADWSKDEMDDYFLGKIAKLKDMPKIKELIRADSVELKPILMYFYADKDGKITPIPPQINTPAELKNFFKAITYKTNVPVVILRKKADEDETDKSEEKNVTDDKKKTLAEGLLDIAMLTGHVSLMISVVNDGRSNDFFEAIISLIVISILLQFILGILLVRIGAKEMSDGLARTWLRRMNTAAVSLTLIIAVMNIFISEMENKFITNVQENCTLSKT